ncbi:nitroreductase family protein [Clostridium omnivorum]|uniref:Nitroreductase n=1 Tax=Clostridium omnivorum TaxID=1604902 RepID=A0ABQ5NA23_9CLOT|nr:nitroreductase family protein [Clostridium sp. E14]GLC31885.1 nitroreductase [Clostridium sp. E14]
MEIINSRRSVRTYKDIKVEKEKVEKLLRAAMQAPSAYNQQAWEFVVVEDKNTLKKLSETSPFSKPVANAPLAFVVLGNKDNMKVPGCWQQDLGAACENLLLEAVELGLGGVWMAVTPEEDRINYIKNMFNLPENIIPYSLIPIGYPADEPKFVDRFDSTKVHYERW